MTALLTLSYVLHVVAGGLWTGGVAYGTVALLPAARRGEVTAQGLGRAVDLLLQVTRATGVVLPLTGAYQIWRLYPTSRLLGTTRGHLVLGMLLLWGVMNGLVELGVYRMRVADGDPPGLARHTVERFGLGADADPRALVGVARPYFLAATALTVLLLVDAALLAGGVAP
ncbi:copper resistance protein CopD [Halobaculum sp. CBA1158]|uniref:copper resistance protein CopD n=1 Tax=Halobaculum sp. CBA1158 TaxID=2904243 RepID=UPI001F3BDE1E|nr:copper resistance protein CopD [Halobaculum sp. CBA1158]UIP00439.1 copper resistance protein CopD [Halobaculum sp. CBA1158]